MTISRAEAQVVFNMIHANEIEALEPWVQRFYQLGWVSQAFVMNEIMKMHIAAGNCYNPDGTKTTL